MDMEFMLAPVEANKKQSIAQIFACNNKTAQFGVVLSPSEAQVLVETRSDTLQKMGRVEFGGGILEMMIFGFCDSPYISQDNYAQTLGELIEIFYYYKSELEWMPDEELIGKMRKLFDKTCLGSIEKLRNSEMEKMVHNYRYGISSEPDTISYGWNIDEEEESNE